VDCLPPVCAPDKKKALSDTDAADSEPTAHAQEVRTRGFGGKFSLLEPSKVFFGDRRRQVRGCRDGVMGDAGATTKLSTIGARGGKVISVCLTVAVFDGHWGEDTAGAAFGIDGSSTSFSFCAGDERAGVL